MEYGYSPYLRVAEDVLEQSSFLQKSGRVFFEHDAMFALQREAEQVGVLSNPDDIGAVRRHLLRNINAADLYANVNDQSALKAAMFFALLAPEAVQHDSDDTLDSDARVIMASVKDVYQCFKILPSSASKEYVGQLKRFFNPGHQFEASSTDPVFEESMKQGRAVFFAHAAAELDMFLDDLEAGRQTHLSAQHIGLLTSPELWITTHQAHPSFEEGCYAKLLNDAVSAIEKRAIKRTAQEFELAF